MLPEDSRRALLQTTNTSKITFFLKYVHILSTSVAHRNVSRTCADIQYNVKTGALKHTNKPGNISIK